MARQKFNITKQQEKIISKNYNRMREADLCIMANISRFQLQRFKRENGLFKNKGHRLAKIVPLKDDGFYHYEKNWII